MRTGDNQKTTWFGKANVIEKNMMQLYIPTFFTKKKSCTYTETQTIPSGSDPAVVDWCKISSNWNVFEPGAAHTEQTKCKSEIVRNTEINISNKKNRQELVKMTKVLVQHKLLTIKYNMI